MTLDPATIAPQPQNFATSRNAAWRDSFPLIGVAALGGVVAAADNTGTGTLSVGGVSPGLQAGVYMLVVQAVTPSYTQYTVTNMSGQALGNGRGVAGVPVYVGGLTLTLNLGSTAFAAGDSFAISVGVQPADLTGLRFTFSAYRAPSVSNLALAGDSAPPGGVATLISGGATGTLSTGFGKSIMGALDPGQYPYNVLAQDPALPDQPFVVFYGTITHGVILQDGA